MAIDNQYIRVMQVFSTPKLLAYRRVIIPGSFPFILSGLRLAYGVGWRVIIGAEMISSITGLGFMMDNARWQMRPEVVVAGMITIGVIGLLVENILFDHLEKLTIRKWGGESGPVKLVTFSHHDENRLGAVVQGRVICLREAYSLYLKEIAKDPLPREMARVRIPSDMVEFIRGGEKSFVAAGRALELMERRGLNTSGIGGRQIIYEMSQVSLKAPIMPQTIICGGANFTDHLEETKRIKPGHVEFFLKSPNSVVGPFKPIKYQPRVTQKLDYEVELAIIIGKEGRYIPPEEAHDYIFGYTILNDISARDRQVIGWEGNWFHLRFGEGKSFDTACPLGPWIVTKDELSDVSNLAMRTWVNQELRQSNNTKNLIWGVPALISYYSTFLTLRPGIVISSGTPGGPALGADLELGGKPYLREDIRRGGYLKPGDIVRCEIEGIGVLENPVVME